MVIYIFYHPFLVVIFSFIFYELCADKPRWILCPTGQSLPSPAIEPVLGSPERAQPQFLLCLFILNVKLFSNWFTVP